mmetsp:Transcript_18120/g.35035  ORF Transcript_18120/g.35035 Transcript_18120/m.35035 type:complete len:147 (+) Transcript_18120:59-499(+)
MSGKSGLPVGYVVESKCTYFEPLSFPTPVTVGIRLGQLGRSSVRYELGIFNARAQSADSSGAKGTVAAPPAAAVAVEGTAACAVGYFVHVFVDANTGKPTQIPPRLRCVLQSLQSTQSSRRSPSSASLPSSPTTSPKAKKQIAAKL